MKTNTQNQTERAQGQAAEAQHTAGPWRESPEGNVWAPNAGHAVICVMSAHGKSESSERANARLIAAAPELLAACKAAAKLWMDDPRLANGGIADRLNAAIARATGAQP